MTGNTEITKQIKSISFKFNNLALPVRSRSEKTVMKMMKLMRQTQREVVVQSEKS